MPAWKAAGGMAAVIQEGFDRCQLEAQLRLSGIPQEDHPDLTDRILDLEAEYARVRAQRMEEEQRKKEAEAATKGSARPHKR